MELKKRGGVNIDMEQHGSGQRNGDTPNAGTASRQGTANSAIIIRQSSPDAVGTGHGRSEVGDREGAREPERGEKRRGSRNILDTHALSKTVGGRLHRNTHPCANLKVKFLSHFGPRYPNASSSHLVEQDDERVPGDPQHVAAVRLDGRDKRPEGLVEGVPHPLRAECPGETGERNEAIFSSGKCGAGRVCVRDRSEGGLAGATRRVKALVSCFTNRPPCLLACRPLDDGFTGGSSSNTAMPREFGCRNPQESDAAAALLSVRP